MRALAPRIHGGRRSLRVTAVFVGSNQDLCTVWKTGRYWGRQGRMSRLSPWTPIKDVMAHVQARGYRHILWAGRISIGQRGILRIVVARG